MMGDSKHQNRFKNIVGSRENLDEGLFTKNLMYLTTSTIRTAIFKFNKDPLK